MDAEAKADRAKDILESDVFQEAVERAKQKLKDQWAMERNADNREALWQQYNASEAVTIELSIIRDNGIVERSNREKKERNRA